MSKHARRRPPMLTPRKRRLGALLSTFALVAAGATLMPANGVTTVPSSESGADGPIVRDSSVTVNVDRAALYYWKGGSSATAVANAIYKAAPLGSPTVAGSAENLASQSGSCFGNNPAAGQKDLSPRTTVTVTGPGGVVALAPTASPARDVNPALLVTGNGKPLSPQPAPNNSNYLGDFPAGGPEPGFTATVNLAGKPAGVYTVTTTNYNVTQASRTSILSSLVVSTPGPCVIGVPDASGKGVINGPVTTETTFEYRPWQQEFNDLLGHGSVSMNLDPKEYQGTADGTKTAIYDGSDGRLRTYASTDSLLLPPDPSACAENPASCVPSAAVECTGQPGCTPRIVVINRPGTGAGSDVVQGIFDLDSRAFIALVRAQGKGRVLLSLGSKLDPLYGPIVAKAVALGDASGIDVMRILTTEVKLTGNGSAVSLSLLNGLQVNPSDMPGGLTITSGITKIDTSEVVDGLKNLAPGLAPTVQAGVIINIAAGTSTGGTCGPLYTVKGTDLVPDVPTPGALGALVGGPVRNVYANFPFDATTTAILGVDTAAGEPNGLPIWVEPLISGVNAAKTRNIDFIGTLAGDTVADIALALGSSCIHIGGFIGAGVAVINNPLPVGLKDVFDPLTTPNPALAPLVDAVSTAVDSAVDSVATNPTVADLLSQIVAAVPTEVPAP